MKKTDMNIVENLIQYKFKNTALLNQAFDFEPGDENDPRSNGLLRIIGRRSLDYALTYILIEYYGSISKNNPIRTRNENTAIYDILDNLVSYDLLKAFAIVMGLPQYVESYGGGELIEAERKILFAIFGAIAVDCNFDVKEIAKYVSFIIDVDYWLDNGFNDIVGHPYIALFNECLELNINIPEYAYKNVKDEFGNEFKQCNVKIGNLEFEGVGNSLAEARLLVCKTALEHLKKSKVTNSIKDDAGEFTEENAMDTLDNLTLKGYFTFADYESKMQDGGYFVVCSISEIPEHTTAFDKDKNKARNKAAYKMLEYLVNR